MATIRDIDKGNNPIIPNTSAWGVSVHLDDGTQAQPAPRTASEGINMNTLIMIVGAILVVYLLMKK